MVLLRSWSGVARRILGSPSVTWRPESFVELLLLEEEDGCSSETSALRLVFNESLPSKETMWLAPSEHQHYCTSSGAKGPNPFSSSTVKKTSAASLSFLAQEPLRAVVPSSWFREFHERSECGVVAGVGVLEWWSLRQ